MPKVSVKLNSQCQTTCHLLALRKKSLFQDSLSACSYFLQSCLCDEKILSQQACDAEAVCLQCWVLTTEKNKTSNKHTSYCFNCFRVFAFSYTFITTLQIFFSVFADKIAIFTYDIFHCRYLKWQWVIPLGTWRKQVAGTGTTCAQTSRKYVGANAVEVSG